MLESIEVCQWSHTDTETVRAGHGWVVEVGAKRHVQYCNNIFSSHVEFITGWWWTVEVQNEYEKAALAEQAHE